MYSYPLQYAVWDLAFHMIPFAKVDPEFAKSQLVLFLREWYMSPNGQIPGMYVCKGKRGGRGKGAQIGNQRKKRRSNRVRGLGVEQEEEEMHYKF